MIYSYIPSFLSLAEIEELLARYPLENPIVASSFDEFLGQIDPAKDEAVVHSATVFSSLIDLLAARQKVRIRSLGEPWLEEIDSHFDRLYRLATEIHTARTNRGLRRAKEQGKKLGRAFKSTEDPAALLARVDALCAENGISIAEACRRLGFSASHYHNARRKVNNNKPNASL